MFSSSRGSFSLIMAFEDSWFHPYAAKNHQSILLHQCWLPERETNQGVSPQASFLLGWGIYARTKVKPSKIKAATTQFKSKIKEKFFCIVACGSLSLPCSHDIFPFLYPCSFSVRHVFSLFLSVKGCLAF